MVTVVLPLYLWFVMWFMIVYPYFDRFTLTVSAVFMKGGGGLVAVNGQSPVL